jgi:hypothetical protein
MVFGPDKSNQDAFTERVWICNICCFVRKQTISRLAAIQASNDLTWIVCCVASNGDFVFWG